MSLVYLVEFTLLFIFQPFKSLLCARHRAIWCHFFFSILCYFHQRTEPTVRFYGLCGLWRHIWNLCGEIFEVNHRNQLGKVCERPRSKSVKISHCQKQNVLILKSIYPIREWREQIIVFLVIFVVVVEERMFIHVCGRVACAWKYVFVGCWFKFKVTKRSFHLYLGYIPIKPQPINS